MDTQEIHELFDRHVAVIALEAAKDLDLEVNAGAYYRERENERKNRTRSISQQIHAVGNRHMHFHRLDRERVANEMTYRLLALGIGGPDDWDPEFDEYVEGWADKAISAVYDHGQRASVYLLRPDVSQSTATERARLVRDAERRNDVPANEIVGDDAIKEALELIQYEATLGRYVLTEEWSDRRGNDEWEDVVAPLVNQGWLRIDRVSDLNPRDRKGLPLKGHAFNWNYDELPVTLWRAADAVKVIAATPWKDLEWQKARAHLPAAVVAEEAGCSPKTVRNWRSELGVQGLPQGRPALK